jgi:hypothetical protein
MAPSSRNSERVITKAMLAAALTLSLACRALAQDIPQDEAGFTQYVASRVQGEIPDAHVVVKDPLALQLGGIQANLGRSFGFCKHNPDRCAMEVSGLVKAIAETYRAQNAPITRDSIRVVVRTAAYVEQVQNSLGPGAPTLLPTPFVSGLVLLPVVDTPTTFVFLNTDSLKKLGLTKEEAQQIALTNTRAALASKPLMDVATVAAAGRIGQLIGDFSYPSRLALFDTWAPLAKAQGGKLIVVAPATDTVLYSSDDSRAAIDALRAMARHLMTQAPHPLSDIVLRWMPTGWQVVP